MDYQISVFTRNLSKDLYYAGRVALTYSLDYPFFSSPRSMAGIEEMNSFYRLRALDFIQTINNTLYPEAAANMDDLGEDAQPFLANDSFEPTYVQGCLVSLYLDRETYTGGAHGLRVRSSDTWNAMTGERFRLSDMFAPGVDYRQRIIESIKLMASEQPEIYFDNVSQLIEETFNEENFYLSPEGLNIYFQQYDIAPYSTGTPVFTIEYDDVGLLLPRCSLARG